MRRLRLAAFSVCAVLGAWPTPARGARPDPARAAGIDWIDIPGGAFMMGARDSFATPVHEVFVEPFQMAKTLVTNKQYRACVEAGACAPQLKAPPDWCLTKDFAGDDQPAVCVDWSQAKAFSEWVGGRLPSEAEWEYAARGGGMNWKYPWGDEAATCERAVIADDGEQGCGRQATWPVCSKPAGNTKQGLCDMAGNAWEWLADSFHESYAGAPADARAWESPAGDRRALRGGCWFFDARLARAAARNSGYQGPGGRGTFIGFRPARGSFSPRSGQNAGDKRLIHLLNRLSFGPRSGDLERLRRQGAAAFISQQLHPMDIDDSECEAKLSAYKTLAMTPLELSFRYPVEFTGAPNARPRAFAVIDELAAAKVLRAAYSKRQLQEVMTDFWFNHFNVYPTRLTYQMKSEWFIASYEREVISPRALGKFRDLLGAVARSPSMLIYLDNYISTIDPRRAPPSELDAQYMKPIPPNRLGVIENYSRELLELHTVGIDGGYAQKDVTELARALTGWTVQPPDEKRGIEDFGFRFRADMHVPGDKKIMGRTFASAGQEEGERILDMLARHPATARFISLKLCRRFLADDPPEPLVKRVAERFLSSDGDIRETLLALFQSPEFSDPRYFHAKAKTPFEFLMSALRASGAEISDPMKVVRVLDAYEPLYLCVPPNGYPERTGEWMSASVMRPFWSRARDLLPPLSGDAIDRFALPDFRLR